MSSTSVLGSHRSQIQSTLPGEGVVASVGRRGGGKYIKLGRKCGDGAENCGVETVSSKSTGILFLVKEPRFDYRSRVCGISCNITVVRTSKGTVVPMVSVLYKRARVADVCVLGVLS